MILSNQIINSIGFSLLHSFWQIVVISLTLFIVNKALVNTKANIRYFSSFVALVLVLLSFASTFVIIGNNTSFEPRINNELGTQDPLDTSNLSTTNLDSKNNSQILLMTDSKPEVNIKQKSILGQLNQFLIANLDYLVIFWLVGVLVLSIRLLAQYVFAERYKYRHKNLLTGSALAIFLSLKEKLRIKKNVQLFESAIA